MLQDLLQNLINGVSPELVILVEIGIIIIISSLLAFLARLIKQPVIPAYIIAGIIIGPLFLGLIKDPQLIISLSQIGIAFLIFSAGLEINFKKIKEVGKVSAFGGIIQIVLMFAIAFLISILLGFGGKIPIYVALVVAFSSTMVVVSLLSERKEIESLHGRIIIGILLIQDIAAIIALSILSSNFSLFSILMIFVKFIILVAISFFVSKIVNPFLRIAAKNKEVLLLVSISFLFLFVIGSSVLNFSIVIGAFFAGVALANSDYKNEINSGISSLKDFFSVIFFVALGMQLSMISKEYFILLIGLLFLVIIIKPFLTMFIVRIFGYKRRTSFLTGNALAQTSEFSLIIATVGLYSNHIDKGLFSTLILLTIISMSLTIYLITYERKLTNILSFPLKIMDRYPTKKEELEYLGADGKKIVLFGCHRMGSLIVKEFEKNKKDLVVVDYNPEIIKNLMNKKIPCIYGDFIHEEILEKINLKNAEIVISTIPDFGDNVILLRKIKRTNSKAVILVAASRISEAMDLYKEGADYVILPKLISGLRSIELIKKSLYDKKHIKELRKEHLRFIEKVHHILY